MIYLDDLNDIFKHFFGDDSLAITRATTAEDVEDWDSLTHMNLVLFLEKQFKIKFTFEGLQSLHSVGSMLDLINIKTAQ
ncbi:acyl carrier protein [Geobacter pelophilus]|uniref:Acyl carrier protein n=1 Tax=Geoanaerobacter pelophilus TaxID=60036 RepID=A0AAW4L0S6_9BACT|nr:acyl carrier protein [Geoanaerobacter pelophilus]MBT0663405.1 acyl carrier protein [Geoanaerobacter pelophilus]